LLLHNDTYTTVAIWEALSRTLMTIPRHYVPGQVKTLAYTRRRSHLYERDGDRLPMCHDGWTSEDGLSYDVWMGSIGLGGICLRCKKNAENGQGGVPPRTRIRRTRIRSKGLL